MNLISLNREAPQLHIPQLEAVVVCRLAGHEGSIFKIAWSSDGSKLVSVSDDRSARFWTIYAGREGHNVAHAVGPVLFGHTARVWDCCLADSELDPPSWLSRMRELGYPPGYLDIEDSDQPSGITIFDDDESSKQKEKISKVDVHEPGRTMSVSFPGINAPITEGANQSRWASSPLQQITNQWSNCSAESPYRGNTYSQRQQSDHKSSFFRLCTRT